MTGSPAAHLLAAQATKWHREAHRGKYQDLWMFVSCDGSGGRVDINLTTCDLHGQLRPGFQTKLAQRVADVRFRGALRHHQFFGDLPIGHSLRHKRHNPLLSLRQLATRFLPVGPDRYRELFGVEGGPGSIGGTGLPPGREVLSKGRIPNRGAREFRDPVTISGTRDGGNCRDLLSQSGSCPEQVCRTRALPTRRGQKRHSLEAIHCPQFVAGSLAEVQAFAQECICRRVMMPWDLRVRQSDQREQDSLLIAEGAKPDQRLLQKRSGPLVVLLVNGHVTEV